MKLFVKLRGSGQIYGVAEGVLHNTNFMVLIDGIDVDFTIGIDCDLCDEGGRLLVPQEDKEEAKTIEASVKSFLESTGLRGFANNTSIPKHMAQWYLQHKEDKQ